MLEVTDLHVSYGHVRAVNGVSFTVKAGECVALLGGNGAGKTTILNTISGLLRPAQGQILFQSTELAGLPAHRIVTHGIVQIPEGRQIFPDLKVRENLLVGAYQRKDNVDEDLARIFELFPVLHARQQQRGETLSGGEQQMLAIGRALMAKPRLLMLDEPSLGLAPLVIERLFEVFAALKQEITLLLVEQNAQLALEVAERAYVLQQGRIVREGSAEQFLQTDWIKEAYLGA